MVDRVVGVLVLLLMGAGVYLASGSMLRYAEALERAPDLVVPGAHDVDLAAGSYDVWVHTDADYLPPVDSRIEGPPVHDKPVPSESAGGGAFDGRLAGVIRSFDVAEAGRYRMVLQSSEAAGARLAPSLQRSLVPDLIRAGVVASLGVALGAGLAAVQLGRWFRARRRRPAPPADPPHPPSGAQSVGRVG